MRFFRFNTRSCSPVDVERSFSYRHIGHWHPWVAQALYCHHAPNTDSVSHCSTHISHPISFEGIHKEISEGQAPRSHTDSALLTDNQVLSQLISITWESAVPPCACALAAFIACMRGVRVLPATKSYPSHVSVCTPKTPFVSYWAVMLQTVLGKLYVISLFVILYVLRQVQCP